MEDIFIQKKRGRKPKNKDNNNLISKFTNSGGQGHSSLNIFEGTDILNPHLKDLTSCKPSEVDLPLEKELCPLTSFGGLESNINDDDKANKQGSNTPLNIFDGHRANAPLNIFDGDDEIIKKKRGRKPTGKIYEINKSLISNMSSGISNCIIAHLPLSEKDIAKIIEKKQDEGSAFFLNSSKLTLTEDQYSDNLSDIIYSDSINVVQKQISEKSFFKSSKSEMPSHSSFIIEADDDIKHKYNEKCVEIDNLKKRYDDLLEKFKKFAYLEDKITDNGVIEKKYYVTNSNILDLCGNCWKESTDSHCWWCSHSFDTVPVGLPNKYCPKQKKFYLYGCFCSFNCAHSYNLDIKDYKVWERYSLLNYIKKIIYKNVNNTDNLIKPIISAPPKEVLKVYGGELSIEEYRNSSISIPKEYYHLLPPMIPIFSVVEEIPKFFYQNRGSKKKNDFGELKIKRNKPLLTQNNNLLNLIK